MSVSKEQQLWEASTSGNLDLVKRLANDPAISLNWGDPDVDRTALYRACGHNRVAVVEFLLKHPKVDANKAVNGGATSFYVACQQNHKEIVTMLLADLRVDVNKPKDEGATPFFVSCQNGHQEVVSLLLADTRIDANKPDNDQCTPLWMASQKGHLPIVELFLASGRDIETQTKSIAGPDAWNDKTAAEVARFQETRTRDEGESEEGYNRMKQNVPLIAALIDLYEQNPQQVCVQLRQQLGIRGKTFFSLFYFRLYFTLLPSFPLRFFPSSTPEVNSGEPQATRQPPST